MRKALGVAGLLVLVTLSLLLCLARPANAQSEETFTFVCETASGTQTFELGKPNPSSAIFTDGTAILVSAIGADITGGAAQPNAVPCTINGEGPFPFLITR
jgi:hypothetical protein